MAASEPTETPGKHRHRSPLLAAILSGFFPGLGQLYNADIWKALFFFVAGVMTAFGPWNPLNVDLDLDDPAAALRKLLLASLPFLLVALWSVLDAFRVARRSSAA